MKKIYLSLISVFLLSLTFVGCSSKKQPVEPYYDRANIASEKAHNKLDKE